MKKTAAMLILAAAFGVAIGAIGSQLVGALQGSPYLKHNDRLADVVAAIQMMGKYKWDSSCADPCAYSKGSWKEAIGNRPPVSAKFWSTVFSEHPEFFRTSDDGKVSLVLRRAGERYDTTTGKRITQDEFDRLPEEQKKTVSRVPLLPDEITELIELAIKMQTQAIAVRQELRWWVPVVVGALGVLVGALLKS